MSVYQLRCIVGEKLYRPLRFVLPQPNSSVQTLIVGRGKKTDLRLTSNKKEYTSRLSRKHLKIIIHADGKIYIKDLGGANGSMLDGKPLLAQEAVELKIGNVLQFGGVKKNTTGATGDWPEFLFEKLGFNQPLKTFKPPSKQIMSHGTVTTNQEQPVQKQPVQKQPVQKQLEEEIIVAPSLPVAPSPSPSSPASGITSPIVVNVKEIQKSTKKRPRIDVNTLNVEQSAEISIDSVVESPLKKQATSKKKNKKINNNNNNNNNNDDMFSMRVDDCLGCAECEDIIIDPIVLRCAHSLCFVCCHRLSKIKNGACPSCEFEIPKDSQHFHRSVKLDMLVDRYINATSTSKEVKQKYNQRLQDHKLYTAKNVDNKHMEVAQKKIEKEEILKYERIIVCDQCGREGHEEDACPYVDSEDDDNCGSSSSDGEW